ncbi:MAG TPA: ribonuclease J [Bacillota bacterium]|nr:ribonuclease J [Bacillota bacterium]HNT02650.1 ribonuclease J [Bacillota bacterium]HPX68710.1 ribonuclease J [Bacillota bacterium]HQA64684.1 ribonuclease J [Bacillota bacterium]HQO42025.1 ribonuclease J [Bacillota bacterium]
MKGLIKKVAKSKAKLKLIPLGGLNEIGKNMTAVEYKDTIVIIDCGLMFPDEEMLGIDLVIPDVTYLVKNKEKVKAILLTHGHEDHIGALPYVLPQINVPVYGTKLTLGLVENKLKEFGLLSLVERIIVKPKDMVKFGELEVEFIKTSHSIADSVALAIHTPVGIIVHSGDFKIDYQPIDGELIDLHRFAELGKQGVLVLMGDSTNVERPGYTMSESTVGATFMELFRDAGGRVILATFASNIHRIQQAINAAAMFNRKVAVVGRSMVNVIGVATELGYINIPEGVMIEVDHIDKYPNDRIMILTTGSQGEPLSALARMSTAEHRKVTIIPGDRVVISANPIPGNEKLVSRVINQLFKKGADVIYESLVDIHVSGHAYQEELKLLQALIKPKYFVPVHGEYRHLTQHAQLAEKMGVNKENIFIADIGTVLEFTKDSGRTAGTVVAGKVLVDGLGVGDVGNIVLRDRKHLSQDGLIVVVVTISKETGQVVAGPDIISRGFVYVRESEDLMEEARGVIKDALAKCEEKQITEWGTIKSEVRDSLREFIYERTKRNPMILPIIMEI